MDCNNLVMLIICLSFVIDYTKIRFDLRFIVITIIIFIMKSIEKNNYMFIKVFEETIFDKFIFIFHFPRLRRLS